MLIVKNVFSTFLSIVFMGHSMFNVSAIFSTERTKQVLIERNKSTVFFGSNETELMSAISSKDFEKAKVMVLNNEQIFLTDSNQRSALHYAARIGNLELVRLLVERGANIDEKDIFSQTPLMLSISEEISNFLIANGANIEFAEANRRVRNFDPLLKIAVMNNSVEEAKNLLEHGAIVNVLDKQARTPLFFCHSIEMAELLVRYGADIKKVDSSCTSIFEVFTNLYDVELLTCLIDICGGVKSLSLFDLLGMIFQSVKINNVEIFKFLIEDVGKIVWENSRNGIDLLCYAIESNSINIVDYILSKNIDINMLNSEKKSPLDVATETSNFLCVKKILAKGGTLKGCK